MEKVQRCEKRYLREEF